MYFEIKLIHKQEGLEICGEYWKMQPALSDLHNQGKDSSSYYTKNKLAYHIM